MVGEQMKIGDKIIRYHIVYGQISSLEVFEIVQEDDKCIKLSNNTYLYKKTLKERVHLNKLSLSRKAVPKRIFYRYKLYSDELYEELKEGLE